MRDSCVGSLLSHRVFFFLFHFFSRHVRKFGTWEQKQTESARFAAPPAARNVYFARFTDCLHVIALSKRFSRACPFDAFFAFSFSENSTAARRPRNQTIPSPLPLPSPSIDLTLLRPSIRSFHSTFRASQYWRPRASKNVILTHP